MSKSRDDLTPVGEDPRRDAAIAAHNAGETKSQDLEPVGDTYTAEVSADLKRAQAVLAENTKLQQEMSGKRGKSKATDRKYPSYTTADLEKFVAEGKGNADMEAEIEARKSGASKPKVTPQIKPVGKPKAKDAEPTPIKTTNLETMPDGPSGNATYAGDKGKAKDTAMVHSGSEPNDHLIRGMQYEVGQDKARALDSYRAAATGFRRVNDSRREAQARDGIASCQRAMHEGSYFHPQIGRAKVCDSADTALRTALERTRAGEVVTVDGVTVRPGMARAKDAKSVPDADVRKLDRLHKAWERAKEAHKLAQRTFSSVPSTVTEQKYDDTKVAQEKAEKAYTEWREKIHRDSRTEDESTLPTSVADEHEGFKKLEGELSHEKGVSDPAAVAAAIGRKKYGAAGMAAKSAAGRAKDSRAVLPV